MNRLQTSTLSLPLIAEFHTLLMEDVRRDRLSSGQPRSDERSAGSPGSPFESAAYFPPSGSEIYEALQDFEQYLQSPADTPPLVRLGLIHYQFEAIHPFADGSGRIGRLLVSLLLHAWDLREQYRARFHTARAAGRQAVRGAVETGRHPARDHRLRPQPPLPGG